MRTADVRGLFLQVWDTIPNPYGEDAINEVFLAIERRPEWLQRYMETCDRITKTVVNTWGAWWVSQAVGRHRRHQVPATSTLIKSYSKL